MSGLAGLGRRRLDRSGRRPGGSHWIRRALVLAALAYVALFAWTGKLVGEAGTAFRDGQLDEAHRALDRAAFWKVRRGRVNDALGVVDLARGRSEEAAAHFADARRGLFHPSAFGQDRILEGFLRQGQYDPARRYAEHRMAVQATPRVAYYLAVAENGLNDLVAADRHLTTAQAEPSLAAQIASQREVIAAKRRHGRADHLVDRRGEAIAAIDLASGRRVILVPDLEPLLSDPAGPRLDARDALNQVRLTIDLEVQRAAEAALGSQRGAIVALDVRTGGVLAAASQPRSGRGGNPPPALVVEVEPGSILKMITLEAALRKGVDLDALFPMECPGWIPIDGLAFRDWTTHRTVASIDEAVSVSCNIAFARIGALVGRDALNAELRRHGFDPALRPAGPRAPDFSFGTGRMLPEDSTHPNFALARRAEGLDSITITPIHAAMIAAGLARGDTAPEPYLVEEKRNILGEIYYSRPSTAPPSEPIAPDQAEILRRSMLSAVTSASGTARRAAVDGVEAAMKTGTSGDNPPGYDALVIGFAPAGDPAVAWAVVAERGGKAEWEGARITKEFLARIAGRLR